MVKYIFREEGDEVDGDGRPIPPNTPIKPPVEQSS